MNWWDSDDVGTATQISCEEIVRHRVRDEMRRQTDLWGAQDNTPFQWLAILTEEVGEVGKELADARIGPFKHKAYVAELVQVAAVAIRAAANYLHNPTIDWAKDHDRI